jgi:type I restriction enzyme, S subunit
MDTNPGPFPLVVTAAFRRTSTEYQLEGEAVCIPLISSTGHGDAAIHRLHYQEGQFALANLLVALLPKTHNVYFPKYLYWYLNTYKDSMLVPLMKGTANVSLKEKDIADVQVNLPSFEEQRRIVARVETLATKIQEARGLRKTALDHADRLLVAMAHRDDLTEQQKLEQGWQPVSIGDIIDQVQDRHVVDPSRSYPNLGIYSFGRGLFLKPPIEGTNTSAQSLYRVKSGQFIYSRLFAFEGSYGIVTDEFDGRYVSNEYPTFECRPDCANPEFLLAYLKSPQIWPLMAMGSKGLGDRRQRIQPEQILAYRIMLPPLEWQAKIAAMFGVLNRLKTQQEATTPELEALLPSILSRAFAGEL